MLKAKKHLLLLLSVAISQTVLADSACDLTTLTNPHHVLHCYVQSHTLAPTLTLIKSQLHDDIEIKTFLFTSQRWDYSKSNNGIWQHELVMYTPKSLQHNSPALLFVNGGTRNPQENADNPAASQLDFSLIAKQTGALVVVLNDIPNQYLQFDDGQFRNEDNAVAYTLSKYLDDPAAHAYWPLHLPMANAVIKAMDAIQAETNQPQLHFVISGLSKRGWATWLAALEDDKNRIDAIIPMVIDILDTDKNLQMILASCEYDLKRKPALLFYANKDAGQDVISRVGTDNFKKLTQIIDPVTYLNCNDIDCPNYQKHLSIPKYIISASGDDFFIPDSLKLYVDQLPGETEVEVIPNQSHFIERSTTGKEIIQSSLVAYIHTLQGKAARHTLQISENGLVKTIQTDAIPESMILWEAQNENAHDFRLTAGITYIPTTLVKDHCNHTHHCQYTVTITQPLKGWKASFIEATFKQPTHEKFVVTSSVYVTESK